MHYCPRAPKDPTRQCHPFIWQAQPCPLASVSTLAMEDSAGHSVPHITAVTAPSICLGSSLRHSTCSATSSILPLLEGLGLSWLPGRPLSSQEPDTIPKRGRVTLVFPNPGWSPPHRWRALRGQIRGVQTVTKHVPHMLL